MQWVPKASVEQEKVTPVSTPLPMQEVPSSHDAGWIAATKVARVSSRLQKSMGVQLTKYNPLDKSQRRNIF